MPGSSFGRIFRVTTFGESHGKAIGCIIEGMPPNIELDESDIQHDLNRRRPGQSAVATPRQEKDQVEIVSGVFEGKTMGPSIALIIRNKDYDPSAYVKFKHKFRPGHADYSYLVKYGIRDWRGSGRASGRETATRVAAGAVAKKFLAAHGITVTGYTSELAGIKAEKIDVSTIEDNIVRCPDPDKVQPMIDAVLAARDEGDSVGGVVEVRVSGMKPGLGDPVFDKLEARLAYGILSIGSVKGFEVGIGFGCTTMKGSEFNDPFVVEDGKVRTSTNHSGGILGGISTGEDVVVRAAIRPPASIAKKQQTINWDKEAEDIEVHGRHDPSIAPRAVPVLEAMVAMTIADCLLIQEVYLKEREHFGTLEDAHAIFDELDD